MATLYSVCRYNPITKKWVVSFQTKEVDKAYRHWLAWRSQNYEASIYQAYVDDDAEFTQEDEFREHEELRGDRQ